MFNGDLITLRGFELKDIDGVYTFWNTLSLRRELGPIIPKSRKEIEDWIRDTWKDKQEQRAFTFAIETQKEKKLIGYAQLKNIRKINRTATVSIAIFNEKNRGKGYGTDAMKVLLYFGFEILNLHRIGLNVFETNPRAIKVYQKVGFKKVGVLRETDFVEGKYVNDVAMDILEHEWKEKNKK